MTDLSDLLAARESCFILIDKCTLSINALLTAGQELEAKREQIYRLLDSMNKIDADIEFIRYLKTPCWRYYVK